MSFSALYTKTVKTSGNLLFACKDNLNNLWLLLHRFQKFAFSVKTIRLCDNDIIITISFSNLCTLKIAFKVIVFSENDHCFYRFRIDARSKRKEKYAVSIKTI